MISTFDLGTADDDTDDEDEEPDALDNDELDDDVDEPKLIVSSFSFSYTSNLRTSFDFFNDWVEVEVPAMADFFLLDEICLGLDVDEDEWDRELDGASVAIDKVNEDDDDDDELEFWCWDGRFVWKSWVE